MSVIVCRAKVDDECYDGQPLKVEEPEEVEEDHEHEFDAAGDCKHCDAHQIQMSEDGTYLVKAGNESMVCDACYLMLMPFTKSGHGLWDEIEQAIDHVQASLKVVREHPHPVELRDSAKNWAEMTPVGTPSHRSAMACVKMAEKEIEKRRESKNGNPN